MNINAYGMLSTSRRYIMNINAYELNKIQGLINYLNKGIDPGESSMSVDCKVIDSNGETLGRIEWTPDQDEYVFMPGDGQ